MGFLPSPNIGRPGNRRLDRYLFRDKAKIIGVRALWLCKSVFYSTRPLKWAHAEVPTTTLIFDPVGGGSLTFRGPGGTKTSWGSPNLARMLVAPRGTIYQISALHGQKSVFFLGHPTAGLILLKFWLKTRKSILNKVRKFQAPTSNSLGVGIETTGGGGESVSPRNMANEHPVQDSPRWKCKNIKVQTYDSVSFNNCTQWLGRTLAGWTLSSEADGLRAGLKGLFHLFKVGC